MTTYSSAASAAQHLKMLLDERFEQDDVTRWVLVSAVNAARRRAQSTGDLEDMEIAGLLKAVEKRGESTFLEQSICTAIKELCAMLGVEQGAEA
jgi:hypothetical protein